MVKSKSNKNKHNTTRKKLNNSNTEKVLLRNFENEITIYLYSDGSTRKVIKK
jgi:hypothetical protein